MVVESCRAVRIGLRAWVFGGLAGCEVRGLGACEFQDCVVGLFDGSRVELIAKCERTIFADTSRYSATT